jgi:hypothetical protein
LATPPFPNAPTRSDQYIHQHQKKERKKISNSKHYAARREKKIQTKDSKDVRNLDDVLASTEQWFAQVADKKAVTVNDIFKSICLEYDCVDQGLPEAIKKAVRGKLTELMAEDKEIEDQEEEEDIGDKDDEISSIEGDAGRGSTPAPNPMMINAVVDEEEEVDEPCPMLSQEDDPPIVAVAPPATTAAATLLLPDAVPSESVPMEQVSSSVDMAMVTTTKRGMTGMGGSKKKKRKRRQRQEVDDGSDDEDDDDPPAVPQLPANMYDKLPPKLRNDVLWQQASTKYEQAQSLLGKCQDLWTTTQQQQQQQEQNVGTAAADPVLDPPITVLHSYVLPAVPAKVAPPSATTDYLLIPVRVYEYTTALSERNAELETYIAALEAWTMRMDNAAQHWFDQSKRRQQSRQAFVAARVALQRAQVHDADAQRAEQQALAALLASTAF